MAGRGVGPWQYQSAAGRVAGWYPVCTLPVPHPCTHPWYTPPHRTRTRTHHDEHEPSRTYSTFGRSEGDPRGVKRTWVRGRSGCRTQGLCLALPATLRPCYSPPSAPAPPYSSIFLSISQYFSVYLSSRISQFQDISVPGYLSSRLYLSYISVISQLCF